MSTDFVSVSGKIHDREESMQLILRDHALCSEEPMTVTSPQVSILSNTVALIVYKYQILGTCRSGNGKVQMIASSVWVRRDGKWQVQMHSELAAGGYVVQSGNTGPSRTKILGQEGPKHDDD